MGLYTGQRFGSYEIVKLLGRGGMGEVYLATDPRLNRNVAIKILSSNILPSTQLMERFRREAGLSAALNHPNICTIYETGEVDGQTYICMEYVEGISLRDRLRRSPMNLQEILDTAIQIADALDEARKKNIVHRDIKTGNILLTSRSHVKILDFGLAKQLRDDSNDDLSRETTDAHLTKTGEVRGTVAYMSPEQALGRRVDHRSDIFSFGIVLYEMLAGQLPFGGNSSTEVVDAILHKEPLPVTRFNNEVSDELIRVLNKMLQKDPELRYQSVHEVWVDLRRIQTGGKTSEGFAKRQRWWERKNFPFWPAAIIAGVLLMLVGFAWVKSFRKGSGPIKSPPATIAQPRLVEVAVLPFRYAGDDPDRSYLGAMVTDALIAGLQVVPGLAVAPYENVREIKADSGVKNIANHLGVQSLVKGVVTLKGEATEITTEIISSDGSLLAKQTLTGRPVSTIELIKKNILSALHVADIGAKQIDQIRTPSVEAYKKYLEGRNHHEGWDVEGNLQKAAKLYEEALITDPDFAAARALLAITLVSEFHQRHDASLLSKANVEAKRAMALDPDLPEALLALGMIQLESGNSIEARDAFTRALEVAPGNDAACRSLGAMYASLGRNEEARDMLKRAVELRPSYSTNHYELGTFELQYAGDFKAARLHLEKAHELHPNGYAPLVVLGGIDLLQGNLESAETYFRKAIERSPNAYSYNNLGMVYYYRGQYELALRNWEAVLKEAPEKPLYRANVADALRQLGEREQAGRHYKKVIEDFRASLKLNRSDDKSRAGLAMALAAIGECEEASELTRGVLSRHPDSPELAAYAAIAVSRCDDLDWAKQIVLNSIAADNLLMIRYDPDLNRLRQFPEVKEALAKLIPSAS